MAHLVGCYVRRLLKLGGISTHMCRKWKSLRRYLTSKYLSASYPNNFQLKIKSIHWNVCCDNVFNCCSIQPTANCWKWTSKRLVRKKLCASSQSALHSHTYTHTYATHPSFDTICGKFFTNSIPTASENRNRLQIDRSYHYDHVAHGYCILKCVLQCEHINIFALYNGKINQRAHKLNFGSEILWFSKERFSLLCEITQQYHAILCRRNHLDINKVLSA